MIISINICKNNIYIFSLKKDGYVCKKSRKRIRHVINKNEIAKKNYVIDNIINIPEKPSNNNSLSPSKELGNWPRARRELFTSIYIYKMIFLSLFLYYYFFLSLSLLFYILFSLFFSSS